MSCKGNPVLFYRERMPSMDKSQQTIIQAKVFDFAFSELVRNQRNSFDPMWTPDSWAKFLIWIALNCGFSGQRDSLELFAEALGAPLTSRMRRIFFERTFEYLDLKMIGEPAEDHVLIMPIGEKSLNLEKVVKALEDAELTSRVSKNRDNWKELDSIYAIPWGNELESKN